MQIVRTFVSAVIAIVVPVVAVAQTTVTINATSGTTVIANGYSTSGGLTLNMGFLMDVLAVQRPVATARPVRETTADHRRARVPSAARAAVVQPQPVRPAAPGS